jgi:hypothetical protein
MPAGARRRKKDDTLDPAGNPNRSQLFAKENLLMREGNASRPSSALTIVPLRQGSLRQDGNAGKPPTGRVTLESVAGCDQFYELASSVPNFKPILRLEGAKCDDNVASFTVLI